MCSDSPFTNHCEPPDLKSLEPLAWIVSIARTWVRLATKSKSAAVNIMAAPKRLFELLLLVSCPCQYLIAACEVSVSDEIIANRKGDQWSEVEVFYVPQEVVVNVNADGGSEAGK